MSVVLLTNNSNRGQALAHLIVGSGLDLKLVVVENAALKAPKGNSIVLSLRLNLGKPYRWFKLHFLTSSENRQALKYEAESIEAANKLVDDYILELGVQGRPEGVEYLETPSLNEATVITAVNQAQPDVCVVLGTSIIRERLISIPKIGMINAHTSILPEYRGSRSEFWQCYNQDFANVGMTLHFIDKGVDTGDILFQKHQEVGENPDPNVLRTNNTLATLKNYVPVLKSVMDGTANPIKQKPCTTPTYRFRDITLEKRLRVYKRILSKND
ncbi:MAG: folate-dependent phosphoribosylglycinamide formyltransferase PurN [Bacteroidia bacterium]|jgi:folate-dependent phosphoribosylglycinamide formyltransferase PurN